jgi:hypothetical protein
MKKPDTMQVQTIELGGQSVSYRVCRVLPDTALMLREVMQEAERLWALALGEQIYDELRKSPEGDAFFAATARLDTVPPNRRVLSVWLPFPVDFAKRIKPQLVDSVEEATP